MKIEIPDYLVPRIQQKAQENGLGFEEYVYRLLETKLKSLPDSKFKHMSNEEYLNRINSVSGMVKGDLKNPEAMFSREELYED